MSQGTKYSRDATPGEGGGGFFPVTVNSFAPLQSAFSPFTLTVCAVQVSGSVLRRSVQPSAS